MFNIFDLKAGRKKIIWGPWVPFGMDTVRNNAFINSQIQTIGK